MDNGGRGFMQINVGGVIFSTTTSTLATTPPSMLSTLCTTSLCHDLDTQNRIFLDRDSGLFQIVLSYLRSGTLEEGLSEGRLKMLKIEADYFCIEPLKATIQSRLHLMNTKLISPPVASPVLNQPRTRVKRLIFVSLIGFIGPIPDSVCLETWTCSLARRVIVPKKKSTEEKLYVSGAINGIKVRVVNAIGNPLMSDQAIPNNAYHQNSVFLDTHKLLPFQDETVWFIDNVNNSKFNISTTLDIERRIKDNFDQYFTQCSKESYYIGVL